MDAIGCEMRVTQKTLKSYAKYNLMFYQSCSVKFFRFTEPSLYGVINSLIKLSTHSMEHFGYRCNVCNEPLP
jgi:hypothetical protein